MESSDENSILLVANKQMDDVQMTDHKSPPTPVPSKPHFTLPGLGYDTQPTIASKHEDVSQGNQEAALNPVENNTFDDSMEIEEQSKTNVADALLDHLNTRALQSGEMETPSCAEEIVSRFENNSMSVDCHPPELTSTNSRIGSGTAKSETIIEGPEFESDSSPYTSTSEEDSSSDDDSDDEFLLLDPAEQARRLMEDDGGSDDEAGPKAGSGQHPRTLNEKSDEDVVVPDVEVTPDMKIEELGKVEVILENMALIKAKTSGEYQVLEVGSVLCLEDRVVIGAVAETLGRVQEPMYIVRFVNSAAIESAGISRDVIIYYVPSHSTFVFTKALQGIKGSDASNIHDEEVGDEGAEFSDDEAEAEYKRNLKLRRQSKRGGKIGADPRENLSTGGRQNGASTSGLSYDDPENPDDLYTPLSRPSNLHEMMRPGAGSTEFPQEGYSRGPNNTRGSSRSRGRGDRGRFNRRGRGDRNGGYPDRGQPHSPVSLSQPPTPTFPSSHHSSPVDQNHSPFQPQGFPPNQGQYTAQTPYQNFYPPAPHYGQQSPSFGGFAPPPQSFSYQYGQNQNHFQQNTAFAQPNQPSSLPPFPPGVSVNPAFFAHQTQNHGQGSQQQIPPHGQAMPGQGPPQTWHNGSQQS